MLSLKQRIHEKIMGSPNRAISFTAFMEMALYEPDMGYYAKRQRKIGKDGDFYTSSSVHPIFGETLGEYIWDEIQTVDAPIKYVAEMGGGDGKLSEQVIKSLLAKGERTGLAYLLIEASPYHRELQMERLSPYNKDIPIYVFPSIEMAKRKIPDLQGLFFSNELPDAFPVHMVTYQEGQWKEVYITLDKKEEYQEILIPAQGAILEYCYREKIPQREGYRTEINLQSLEWMAEVTSWMKHGTVITIDYGYLRDELYAPWRNRGTLMCYCNHQALENPYMDVGDQDITSHVNFSALEEIGRDRGLQTAFFGNQGQFLMKTGILHKLQTPAGRDPFRDENARRNRAIRQLIMEGEMGGVFKVLVQKK